MVRLSARPARRPRVECLEDRLAPALSASAAVQSYLQTPLSFEANVGQTNAQVQYLARGQGYALFLSPDEAVLRLHGEAGEAVLRAQIVGGNPYAASTGLQPQAGSTNYIIGNDAAGWRSDVPHFAQVEYAGVYPGIDLVYYGTSQQQLEYDFIVAPGADPGVIRVAFDGAEGIHVDAQGNLILHTAAGDVVQQAPVVYQEIEGRRQTVAGAFDVVGNQVGFRLGDYDRSRELVIDPILFSSFVGGTNNESMYEAVIDPAGNIYIAGRTNSADYPLQGAFDGTLDGGQDVFITKINEAGTAIVYSTYLGGTASDGPTSGSLGLAVNAAGEVVVTSETVSNDFPMVNAFQSTRGGVFSDAFVAKLDATGGSLVFSTFLGGGGFDCGQAATIDGAGNITVGGNSTSNPFPTSPGAYQTTYNGGGFGGDAFIVKYTATGNRIYSTLLGGSGDESVLAIRVVGNEAVVLGFTQSNDLVTTAGVVQPAFGGGGDAFVARFDLTGQNAVYVTYLGGTGSDFNSTFCALTVDVAGNAYIGGVTASTDYPTTGSAYQAANAGGNDAVLTILDPTGASLVYSTYFGGSSSDAFTAIARDGAGRIFLGGDTSSANIPLLNNIQNLQGNPNALVVEFDSTGTTLLFSTPVGGGGDNVRGIGFDATGDIWIAGNGGPTFPQVNPLLAITGGNPFVAKVAPNFAGVTITQTGGSTDVLEAGGTDTYTIVLNSAPTAAVAITLTGTQVNGNPAAFTFNPAFWNIPQTILVAATADSIVEGPHTGVITHTASSADLIYNGIAINNVTANITDDDVAGITLVQTGGTTTLTEGGGSDNYTVALSAAPTANVLVTLTPDAQSTVVPTVLTFTPVNWAIPQNVTLTAVNDLVAEGTHNGIFTHTCTSTDANFNGLTLAAVTASITDNDTAGVIVTPSAGSTNLSEAGLTDTYTLALASQPTSNVVLTLAPDLQLSAALTVFTFTPATWNVAQPATLSAFDDLVAEGVHGGVVSHTSTSADAFYSGLAIASLTATITDNDTAGVSITPTGASTDVAEGGATDTYRIVLTTQPMANVTITLNPDASLSVSPAVLTFTNGSWNVAQTVTVSAVDDAVFQGPHTGTIGHTAASTDTFYNALAIANLTVAITDNDAPPGVLVTEAVGGVTALEGGTSSYTVVLQTLPGADVVVNLAPDAQVTLSTTSLTFTPANWNIPQAVTVTMVDDTVTQGTRTSVITQAPSSADPAYNVVSIASVTATIVDNDGTPILGTERADKILVNFAPGQVQVSVNNVLTVLRGTFVQFVVHAGEGDDYVQVTNPLVPVIVLGEGGEDRTFVVGAAKLNTFVLNSLSVAVGGVTVSLGQTESLVVGGRNQNDVFRLQTMPALPTELKGEQGNDTIIAPAGTNDWNVQATNVGTLNTTIHVNGIENWLGGAGDDTFVLNHGKGLTGRIDGAGGSNTLDYSAYVTPVAINLQTGAATSTRGILNVQSLLGGLGADKLTGRNQNNAWMLTGDNAGDVNGVTFASFENLTGGSLADAFAFADGARLTGKLDGGGASDVLDFASYLTPIAINLQARTASQTGGILNLESFVAGSGGNDSLTGLNSANQWSLTDNGTGTLNKVSFAAFENLFGGIGIDTFTLGVRGDWDGLVDGGKSRDSLFSSPGRANLWTNGVVGAGTLNGKAFVNIEFRR